MKTFVITNAVVLLVTALVLATATPGLETQQCRPSGTLAGKKPPPGQCAAQTASDCCAEGATYRVYACSPPVNVAGRTAARLALGSFQPGADGRPAAACDSQYHPDDAPVVALSTGWFDRGSRCLKNITIHGNGRSVAATVVDECDSTAGCDAEHGFRLPCGERTVDASRAVWRALGVPRDQWGGLDVTWSDR